MEISSRVVSNSLPCYYSRVFDDLTQLGQSISRVSRVSFGGGKRNLSLKGKRRNWDSCGYVEKGHLDYYKGSPVCGERKEKGKTKGWNEVATKKKMKLVKGLVKDLEEFSKLGFGLQLDCENDEGLSGTDEKSKMISEAAEVLLAQLKQLKSEEEKMKKEKDCDSSSSSESSDSECDEIIDMKCFKKPPLVQTIQNLEVPFSNLPTPEGSMGTQKSHNMILETTLNKNSTLEALNPETLNLDPSNPSSNLSNSMTIAPQEEKRIEVCMGGKCKKMGGPALMEEFQRVAGDRASVVGCKCMGKCKMAPNVRVTDVENIGIDSIRSPSYAVFTGVGVEDVEVIVANYVKEGKSLGVVAPLL